MNYKLFFLVAIGGAVGSMLRYFIQTITQQFYTQPFPLATLFINTVGCFCIGIIYALAQKHQFLNPEWRLTLATGFCGGFTTFSAFTLENIQLFQYQKGFVAILYITLSIALGLLATWAGIISFK